MNINYTFKYWGPFLFQTEIEKNINNKIFKLCERKIDHRKKLAGHLSEEYTIDKNKFFNLVEPYLNCYLKSAENWYNKSIGSKIEITSSWVNFMKKGEFNPPHIHEGDLSCVIYLQIPKKLNIEEHIASSPKPGSISFSYGEERNLNINKVAFFPKECDFFIFPANLNHMVFPFKSEGERISVSANFNLWP